MNIYTREDWHRDGTFKAVPGQEVAEEIYEEMRDALPPYRLPRTPETAEYSAGYLVGEPYDCDPQTYKTRYMAFARRGGRCYYLGLLPV